MRLIFFVLLCFLVLFLIRRLQSASDGTGSTRRRRSPDRPPAAKPDEIVDVRFEEHDASSKRTDKND